MSERTDQGGWLTMSGRKSINKRAGMKKKGVAKRKEMTGGKEAENERRQTEIINKVAGERERYD